MDPQLTTAVITAAVAMSGSWFVTRGDRARISVLENRINRLERSNRFWWLWAKQVIALWFTWRKEGAPDLPPIPVDDED